MTMLPDAAQLSTCTFRIFIFNHPPTTEIYTLSLHDALPICHRPGEAFTIAILVASNGSLDPMADRNGDRKSTRLNSSHVEISYAVFCLKKKMEVQIDGARLFRRVVSYW